MVGRTNAANGDNTGYGLNASIVAKNRTFETSYPDELDVYGNIIPCYFIGCGTSNYRTSYNSASIINFKDRITEIKTRGLYGANRLQHISCPDCTTFGDNILFGAKELLTANFPKASTVLYRWFYGDTKLTDVQLGSVGYPISSISWVAFQICTQLGLTITVYVTPETQPLANSPWGATNATIVYRSSVTGEVL